MSIQKLITGIVQVLVRKVRDWADAALVNLELANLERDDASLPASVELTGFDQPANGPPAHWLEHVRAAAPGLLDSAGSPPDGWMQACRDWRQTSRTEPGRTQPNQTEPGSEPFTSLPLAMSADSSPRPAIAWDAAQNGGQPLPPRPVPPCAHPPLRLKPLPALVQPQQSQTAAPIPELFSAHQRKNPAAPDRFGAWLSFQPCPTGRDQVQDRQPGNRPIARIDPAPIDNSQPHTPPSDSGSPQPPVVFPLRSPSGKALPTRPEPSPSADRHQPDPPSSLKALSQLQALSLGRADPNGAASPFQQQARSAVQATAEQPPRRIEPLRPEPLTEKALQAEQSTSHLLSHTTALSSGLWVELLEAAEESEAPPAEWRYQEHLRYLEQEQRGER